MNVTQLEHVVLEIGRRFGLDYFYIIGASAALAQIERAPATLLLTRDVDVIPNLDSDSLIQAMADRIDFVIGEGSDFDKEYGYYAQGVDFGTPRYAPEGWQERCVPLRVGGITALCMELHDLLLAKVGAGRDKDLSFAAELVSSRWVKIETLLARVERIPTSETDREHIRALIRKSGRTGQG